MIRLTSVALLALLSLRASTDAQPASPQPAQQAGAQSPEAGQPFVRNYGPLEIGGGDQTWAIVQGRDGAMYFATNRAVLEYRRQPLAALCDRRRRDGTRAGRRRR